jgi:hypothetical protein
MNSFTFLFEAMKETHEQHKTKLDIDELIPGPTNITQCPSKQTNEVFGQTNISPSQGDATSTLMHTTAYTVRVVLDFLAHRLLGCLLAVTRVFC